MKEKLKQYFIFVLLLLITGFFGFLSISVKAQDSLSLTITPPLIKVNMDPGETWSSFVKVVNDNSSKLTVYAHTMDFKSGKEGGLEFIPKSDIKEGQRFLLSQWIEIESGPFVIAPFKSKKIPFTIRVPEDAEPGGHYAAILIGTKPPANKEIKGSAIKVASQVTSLILLNIEGEVTEQGFIREFSTERLFYQKPEVKFKLSFANSGNVHLHPVGEIKIYNMWDKERGTIPINKDSHFGNVLPQSKRTWIFEWRGEESPFEIGRYKAELILSFGQQARQTASSIIYFWIIPLGPVLGILGGFLIFLLALILGVRAYVRKAVIIAQKEAGLIGSFAPAKEKIKRTSLPKIKLTTKVLKGPIKEAILDLRKIRESGKRERRKGDTIKKIRFLLKKYYKFQLFILVILLGSIGLFFYFKDTLKPEKSFEVIQTEETKGVPLSPEEIFEVDVGAEKTKEKAKETPSEEEPPKESSEFNEIDKASLSLKILNGSGMQGLAGKTATFLEKEGFNNIKEIGNADSFNYSETIIKYKKGKEKEAGFLKELLGGIGQKQEIEGLLEDIVIIIGKDLKLP